MTPEDIRLLSQITGALPPKNAKRLNEVPFPMGDPRMEEERKRLEEEYQAGRAAQRKTFRDAPIEEQIKAIGNTAGFFGGAVLEGLAEPFAKLGGGTAEGSLTGYFAPKGPAQVAALSESAETLYPVAQMAEASKVPDMLPAMFTAPTRLVDDATRQAAMAAKRGVKAAGRAASSMEDMLRQRVSAPVGSIQLTQSQTTQNPLGFYSALDRATDSLQNKGTGQQFLNQITNMQGVKPDEIKWTGLDDYLRGKKDVTKQEVKDYLNANQVKLEEVRLEGSPKQYYVYDAEGQAVAGPFNSGREAERAMENVIVDHQRTLNPRSMYYDDDLAEVRHSYSVERSDDAEYEPRFQSYSTPGGQNYRELLLTLPEKKVSLERPVDLSRFSVRTSDDSMFPYTGQRSIEIIEDGSVVSRRSGFRGTDEQAIQDYANTVSSQEQKQASSKLNFRSSHFDQPNILAHMRVSDFEQDGKKIMLVDEVQSDWHQAGRKKGYGPQTETTYEAYYTTPNGQRVSLGFGATQEEAAAAVDPGWKGIVDVKFDSQTRKVSEGVPDAPFKTTWHELALRRAVREASEKGFDKIAIPTGSVQNDRYKLSNFINAIDYRKNDDGTYGLIALDDQGNSVITKNRLTESQLEDTIGKEMAKKIVNGVGESFEEGSTAAKEGYKKISGIDLEVGGEGMKGFYDQMVPKYLNKLGSKFGTKVTRGTIKDANGKDVPVHELTITPQMRKSVLEQGQPLFAAVPAVGLTQEEEGYAKGGAVRKKPAKRLRPGAKLLKLANGGPVSGIKPYSLDAKAARKVFDVPGVGPVEMFVDEASKRLVVSDEGYWNPNSPVGEDLKKVVDWARSQGYQAGVVVTPYASEHFGQDMVAGVGRRMPGATDDQLREYVSAADFVIVDPYIVNPESATPDMQNWMSTFTKNVGQYAEDQGKDAWLYLQGFAPSSVGNEVVENYNQRLIDENKGLYDQLSFFNMSDFPDYEDSAWAQQINIDPLLKSVTPETIEPPVDALKLQQFDNELRSRIDSPQTQLDRLSANSDLLNPIQPVAEPIKEAVSPSSDILAGFDTQPIKPTLEIDKSFEFRSPYEKAQEYNRLLQTASDQDIRDAATRTFGAQSDENWQGLQSLAQGLRAPEATAQMNPLEVTTTRQLAAGGAIKKAVKAAKEASKKDVVYRGDPVKKESFSGLTYFTDDPSLAQMYADDRAAGMRGASPTVTSAMLDLKNPASDREILAIAKQYNIKLPDEKFPAMLLEENSKLVSALKQKGFDGVIATDGDMSSPAKPVTSYVAFEPSQIKKNIENKAGGGAIKIKKVGKAAKKAAKAADLEAEYSQLKAALERVREGGRTPVVPAPNRWFMNPEKFPGPQGMIERALANVNQERSAFGSGAYINPVTGEILDSAVMENLLVAIDPKTGRPMMSGRMTDLKELEKSLGSQTLSNLVRKGLFKHSGGDPILADLPFIATIEKGPHFYGLSTEYASPAMLFNTGKGDNPTLRPKSRGSVFAVGDEVGEVQLQGRPHPVYEKLMVAPVGSDVQGKLLKKAGGGAIKKAAKAAKAASKAESLEEGLERFLADSAMKDRLFHHTTTSFDAFKPGGNDPALSGPAIWMTTESNVDKAPIGHQYYSALRQGRGVDARGNIVSADAVSRLEKGQLSDQQRKFIKQRVGEVTPSRISGMNTMPVYASLKNPVVTMEGAHKKDFASFGGGSAWTMNQKQVDAMKRAGHDGIMLYDKDGNLKEVVAFDPAQVKSAVGNRGTYDINDPDITKAGGGAIRKAAKAAKAASKASEPKEQSIYWGMYRGYAGDDVSATEPQFAAMDKKVAEYYAKKRAAQTGLPPHLEMIYKQLEAGRKYGHTVPMDEHNRELLITQAYELQPEEIKGRYQLKKRGGRVKGNI